MDLLLGQIETLEEKDWILIFDRQKIITNFIILQLFLNILSCN